MKKMLSLKKTIFVSTLSFIMITLSFGSVFAITKTDNVIVTLQVDEGLTISDGADTTLAPNIGLTSNGAIGSSSWTVTTNAIAGYTLAVKATTTPALRSTTDNFADYTEATPGSPETWSVASGAKEFGYSVYGTDASTATWGTGTSCGAAGAPSTTLKYVGLKTTDKIVATRNSVTPTAGITTNICFAAQQNNVFASAGTYTATVTATATTL